MGYAAPNLLNSKSGVPCLLTLAQFRLNQKLLFEKFRDFLEARNLFSILK